MVDVDGRCVWPQQAGKMGKAEWNGSDGSSGKKMMVKTHDVLKRGGLRVA